MKPNVIEAIDLYVKAYRESSGAEGALRAVFYTDGSCDNGTAEAERIGGAGVHGYLCDPVIPEGRNARTALNSQVTVTTHGYVSTSKFNRNDGSGHKLAIFESNNAKATAVATAACQVCHINIHRKEPASSTQPSSNNRAELLGLIEALKAAKALADAGHISHAHFRLDSEYARKCAIEWRLMWKKNHWRNAMGSIKNRDLVIEIDDILGTIKDCILTFEWIKGHSDFVGNIIADRLAAEARVMLDDYAATAEYAIFKVTEETKKADEIQEKITISEAPPMLLGAARQYYSTDQHNLVVDGKRYYYLGRHGKKNDDAQYGHRMGDLMYGVVLSEPDDCLERLMTDLKELDEQDDRYDLARIYITSLPYMALKGVRERITKDGLAAFDRKTTGEVFIDDKRMLCAPKNPIGSAFIAMEALDHLKEVLDHYRLGTLSDQYQVTPITEHFYGTKESKKGDVKIALPEQLSIKCKVKHRHKDGPVAEHTVQLSTGIDFPNRRLFLSLVDDNPVIEVITFHVSEVAFRYMVAIRTDSGRAGIYSGTYSNLRILTARELPK